MYWNSHKAKNLQHFIQIFTPTKKSNQISSPIKKIELSGELSRRKVLGKLAKLSLPFENGNF
jgi:predicted transcriptional regulator